MQKENTKMKLKLYQDVQEFYNDTYEILMRHETQNLILLGDILIGIKGIDTTAWRDHINWFMATIGNANGIKLTAMMIPPHNIMLYATDNIISLEAIHCLIDGLEDCKVPGVTTEKTLAEFFAKEYISRKKITFTTAMNERIYELSSVNPGIKKFGNLRLFNERDMHFFPYWFEAFYATGSNEKEMLIPQDLKLYHYYLSGKKIYVLEDNGLPVSMAGYTRVIHSAIDLTYVYTPPYYRGKGYATSCVAQISQMALEKGFTKCVIYIDLANPASNSIYQKIGYKPVCDSLILRFE